MSMSLRRKMALRGQAKDARATEKRLAGLSRAGQVSRSSVVVGDGDVMVEDMLVGAVDTALTTEGLESDVGFLDEGVSADLGVTLDAGDSVGDVLIDVADSVPDLGAEFDYTADVDGSAHTARMEAIGANAAVDEAQAVADGAAQDAANALTTASGKNSRRRGVTEPAPPEGGWVQGDQWVRDEDRDGVMVPVQVLVWDGAGFVPEQIIADDILVLGPDGVVRVANGKVTAEALAVDALDFKTAQGVTLNAGTITGATVRTAASGQRLQLDVGGLKAFNAAGAQVADITSADGGMRIGVGGVGGGDFSVASSDGGVSATAGHDGLNVSMRAASEWRAGIDITWGATEYLFLGASTVGGSPNALDLTSVVPLRVNTRMTTPGNTFALKSQLDAWAPIDGTHAWVTSEGREYVRAGGIWQVAYEDTSWKTVQLSSGWSGTALAMVKNGFVYLTGAIVNGGFSSGSYEQVASLPPDIAPPPSSFVSSYQGVGGPLRNIQIQANGVFYCRTSAASTQAIPFNFSYPA